MNGFLNYLRLILDPNYSGGGYLVNRSTGTQATQPGQSLMESYLSSANPPRSIDTKAERKGVEKRGAGMMDLLQNLLG